jgi:hypothetical protein
VVGRPWLSSNQSGDGTSNPSSRAMRFSECVHPSARRPKRSDDADFGHPRADVSHGDAYTEVLLTPSPIRTRGLPADLPSRSRAAICLYGLTQEGGMRRETLTDRNHRPVGYIETDSQGRQVIMDSRYHTLGHFDPKTNRTTDANHRPIGNGNLLSSLLK